jgi:hypothetical protein
MKTVETETISTEQLLDLEGYIAGDREFACKVLDFLGYSMLSEIPKSRFEELKELIIAMQEDKTYLIKEKNEKE